LCTFAVALRKESVDRNCFTPYRVGFCVPVALRKESVDRNAEFEPDTLRPLGRSPQGERG